MTLGWLLKFGYNEVFKGINMGYLWFLNMWGWLFCKFVWGGGRGLGELVRNSGIFV